MDNKKDNRYYINKIITDLVFITYHTENLTIEELEDNPDFTPYYADGIIALDAATPASHKVNCIVIED